MDFVFIRLVFVLFVGFTCYRIQPFGLPSNLDAVVGVLIGGAIIIFEWRLRSVSLKRLIGAAIGIQSRTHFTLTVFVHRLPEPAQLWIHRFNHALIAGFGALAAWYGFKLCLLNRTLTTPGLEINLAWLYASSVVGGILIVVYALAVMISPLPQGEPQH